MRKEAPFSVTYLRSVLNYLPNDGLFYWRDRHDLDVRNAARLSNQRAGGFGGSGYYQVKIDGVHYSASRLAWFYQTGEWPQTKVYLVDGDQGNLRFSNLHLGKLQNESPQEPFSLEFLRALVVYDAVNGRFDWAKRRDRKGKGQAAGYMTNDGCAKIGIKGRTYPANRIAWFYETGDWPTFQVRHRNGDRADLRFSNLGGPCIAASAKRFVEQLAKPRAPLTSDQLHAAVEYHSNTGAFFYRGREDDPEWSKRFAGRRADRLLDNDRVAVTIDGRLFSAAQLAWLYMTGEWASKVEHIDECTWDNSFGNLTTLAYSSAVLKHVPKERPKTLKKHSDLPQSGCRGVCFVAQTNKWIATITVSGVTTNLGFYYDVEEAIAARKAAEALPQYAPKPRGRPGKPKLVQAPRKRGRPPKIAA